MFWTCKKFVKWKNDLINDLIWSIGRPLVDVSDASKTNTCK